MQATTTNISTNFLSLPSELRNKIYQLVLVQQEPIVPHFDYYQRHTLTPELLRTNKTVHREASSLLYAQNRFDFTMFTSEHVASFLEQIGRNNANYIRHIHVDFPNFLHLDPHDVTLEDDSDRILAKIQSDCTTLSTLTTSLDSTNDMELRLDALDNYNIVAKALAVVDTRFKAILSLQEIIVEVYEDGPSGHIRREMKSHGWTISAIEYVEESDSHRFSSDIEYDDYRYGGDYRYSDDSGSDHYDIDNDSDFWRRAGD